MKKKLRLKKPDPEEGHNLFFCAVVKCKNQSGVIIATSDQPYGLCDIHWHVRCGED